MIDEEADFAIQMHSLAQEASHLQDERLHEEPVREERQSAEPYERAAVPTLAEILKPLVVGIEALSRVTADNSQALERMETFLESQAHLPAVLSALQENLDQKNRLNQKQFDALHEELRTYKDGFLLEIFHKPIVRDLITLFDDLSSLHRRAVGLAAEQPSRSPNAQQIDNLGVNLDHVLHSLLEILARMEVQRLEASTGKLDKQRQRAISVEWAASEQEDQTIVQSVKPGFIWRARLLRPEEVVIRKWKEGVPGSSSSSSQK